MDKISQTGAECHVECGAKVEIETRCRIPIWRRLGQFHSMTNCRVLPPGEFNVIIPELRVTLQGDAIGRIQWHVIPEPRTTLHSKGKFTVMIPEPHATLQGAVTCRNQCHDRATLQGVRFPSAILKIVFRHILFLFNAAWALTSVGFRIVSYIFVEIIARSLILSMLVVVLGNVQSTTMRSRVYAANVVIFFDQCFKPLK